MIWWDKKQVKKGNIGEAIVDEFLESKGFIVYKPQTDGAHAFDRLSIKNKEQVIITECKSKAMRNYYPDTGIDIRHYNDYKKMMKKHRIPVFLFFIDEYKKEVYGNFIKRLESKETITHKGKQITYPLRQKGIIYFYIKKMVTIQKLTDEQVDILIKNSTRSYKYSTN